MVEFLLQRLPLSLLELLCDDLRQLVPPVGLQAHHEGLGQPGRSQELVEGDSGQQHRAHVHPAGQLFEPEQPRQQVGVKVPEPLGVPQDENGGGGAVAKNLVLGRGQLLCKLPQCVAPDRGGEAGGGAALQAQELAQERLEDQS